MKTKIFFAVMVVATLSALASVDDGHGKIFSDGSKVAFNNDADSCKSYVTDGPNVIAFTHDDGGGKSFVTDGP